MAEPAQNGRTANPDVQFERSDVGLKPVLITLAVALVSGVAIHVGVWLFLAGDRAHQDRVKRSTFPLANVPADELPREPRIEQLDRLSAGGERMPPESPPDSYGQTDERGFVRVPVERAIDHLAGKLPSRQEPDADARRRAGGLIAHGESNSGRVFRKGGR